MQTALIHTPSGIDSEIYGQLIYDVKDNVYIGVELLGRPAFPVESIESFFANLAPEQSAKWSMDQLAVGEEIHKETNMLVTVNVDTHALPYISFEGISETNVALEFTDISGLPTVEEIKSIRENHPKLKIILDDYKVTSNLFDSSSAYTPELFDIVKLDICAIRALRKNLDYANDIATTVKKLKQYGCEVIIEGIEFESDLMLVQLMGIRYVQGFFYSYPQHIDSIFEFIDKQSSCIKPFIK